VLVEQIPAGVQARLRLKTTSFVSTLPRAWHGTHDLSSAFLTAVGFECELPNRSEISRTLLSEAAAYLGISATLFDDLVKDRRMPPPKRINSRTIWDRKRLDEAFEALPGGDSKNPWDDVAA
jgi:predicted DNA-binding transcriptional regulator AlpA